MRKLARTGTDPLVSLDPARGVDVDTTDADTAWATMRARLDHQPGDADTADVIGRVPDLSSAPRHRSRRRILLAASLAVVVAAGTVAAFTVVSAPGKDHPTSPGDPVVAQYAPLVRGATITCFDGPVPVGALAVDPAAQHLDATATSALHEFLTHNPFEGMGSVTATGWILLRQTPDRLVFGQREGVLGVGAAALLERRGSSFTATGLSGCSGVTLPDGENTSVVGNAWADGHQLTLQWSSHSSDCGQTHDTVRRVEIDQSSAAVHVLVVVQHPTPVPLPPGTACAQPLTPEDRPSTTVVLDAPLGDRPLYDDGRVSSSPLELSR